MDNNEHADRGAGVSSAHARTVQGPPTQVAYPRRASWRTFIQSLAAFLPTANGILLLLQEFLGQPPYSLAMPGWAFVAVNAAVVLGAFFSKALALVMANPNVEKWLQSHAPAASALPPQSTDS